jgi:DNA-binding IclR family transcriptional regulator
MKPATSIEKVCRVFDALRAETLMGVTAIAERTGLLPSDVHRIVRSLEHFGYIEQDPETRQYRLGLELLKLGYLVGERLQLREVARPHLRRLACAVRATANLAVFDGHDLEVIFVEQVDSPGELQIRLRIGKRVAAHATSVGKVLLAHLEPGLADRVIERHGMPRFTRRTITNPARLKAELDSVRREGYAMDRAEGLEGAWCIGAPVRDHTGRVAAAISISLLGSQLGSQDEARVIALLKETAGRISTDLGYGEGRRNLYGDHARTSRT